MSSLIEAVLLAALVMTTACVVPMYRRLKRFDGCQAQYRDMIETSSRRLAHAGDAVQGFATEGRTILAQLAREIDLAEAALASLKAERLALSDATPPQSAAAARRVG